ncbi:MULTISPECIES: erythromycin resistance leader peptide [Oceanobacillus]
MPHSIRLRFPTLNQ